MIWDALGFLNFMLFALAPTVFCALYFNCRPEKSFLPMLILNSMIFYIMAVFHVAREFFWVLYTANLLLYVPAAVRFVKMPSEERNTRLFTPGFFTILIFCSVTFCFFCNTIFASWDTISHWGKVVKLFMEDGKLGCEYPLEIVSHASYPAGACMTAALIHSCFFLHDFNEGIVLFGHEIINLAAFLWLFSSLNWQNKTHIIKLTLLLFLLPLLYLIACYDPGYTDTLLALLMAICLYQTATLDDYRPLDVFMLAVTSSWMFMIRNAGWGYSIGIMILMAFNLYRDRAKAFYDSVSGKFSYLKTGMIALVFLLPAVMKYLWVFLMKYYHTGQRFGGKNITWEGMVLQFGSLDAPGWIMLQKYFSANLGNLIYIAIFVVIAVRMLKKSQSDLQRSAVKKLLIFFMIAAPAFFATMFIYYLFEFNELRLFPSLPRYSSNFLLIFAFALLMLGADRYAGKDGYFLRKKQVFDHSRRSNVIFLLVLTGVFTLTLAVASLWINGKYGGTKYYITTRKECDYAKKYQDKLGTSGNKFALLTTEGSGIRSFYMSYIYPHNFRNIVAWDPILPGPGNKQQQPRPYAIAVTPEELMAQWQDHKYVYIDTVKDDFIDSYKQLFVPGFEVNTNSLKHRLFEVTSDRLLKPVD
ncbi:MAG: hypothetical protein E7047_02080 [Lentisphaerae bacterium]|nr:hypothetical protein [Lentisphaerota bacterium]